MSRINNISGRIGCRGKREGLGRGINRGGGYKEGRNIKDGNTRHVLDLTPGKWIMESGAKNYKHFLLSHKYWSGMIN